MMLEGVVFLLEQGDKGDVEKLNDSRLAELAAFFVFFGGTFALRGASRASAWEVVVAPFSCFVCAGEASTSEEEKVKVGDGALCLRLSSLERTDSFSSNTLFFSKTPIGVSFSSAF